MNLFLRNVYAIALPLLFSGACSFLLNHYTRIYSANSSYGILFLLAVSSIFNTIYAFKAGKEGFTQLLIASVVVKLLLALSVIVMYSLLDKPGFFHFSLQFILHYVLFTIFEIRYLLYLIKTHPIKHN
jgi:hypothetical protein